MNNDKNKDSSKPGMPQNPNQAGQSKPGQPGSQSKPAPQPGTQTKPAQPGMGQSGTKTGAADQPNKSDRENLESGETNGNDDVEAGEGTEDKATRQARTTGGQQGSTTP